MFTLSTTQCPAFDAIFVSDKDVKMSYDPREHFQQLQRTLQQRRGQGFGGVPGGGAAGRGIVALVGLGIAFVVVNNSLFNGSFQ